MDDDNIIKRKREEMGLSQSQFAELSGVNLRSLQDYEQGRKPLKSVKSEVVYRISAALDCDMEDLIVDYHPVDDEVNSRRLAKYYISFQELFKDMTKPSISSPYDDVFRTLSVDCSELMIPVINEAFGEHYEITDMIQHSQNEHMRSNSEGEVEKKISDSNFVILRKDGINHRYQIECQSTIDNTILLRIFEYASMIATEDSLMEDGVLTVNYPRSALIYLRHNGQTPDTMTIKLVTPGGDVHWDVPVIKTQSFSLDEIFEKHLYMFIPYYIMTYEQQLDEIEHDIDRILALKNEYESIKQRLERAVDESYINLYDSKTIQNMTQRVIDFMTQKYHNINSNIGGIMGGKVLEYEAKDILRQGQNEGRLEGRQEGRTELLMELLSMGVIDESIIDKLQPEE